MCIIKFIIGIYIILLNEKSVGRTIIIKKLIIF